jgi:hypothetical protein
MNLFTKTCPSVAVYPRSLTDPYIVHMKTIAFGNYFRKIANVSSTPVINICFRSGDFSNSKKQKNVQ